MASRLHRKTAGREVAGAMDALADSLLVEEQATQHLMEGLFLARLPVAVSLVVQTHGQGKRKVNTAAGKLGDLAKETIDDSAAHYRRLVDISIDRGLTSIRKELRLCEQSLAKKYSGLADEATDAAVTMAASAGDVSEFQYIARAYTIIGWFEDRVVSELTSGRASDVEAYVDRVVSPTPISNITDHSGRGLWWKVLEHCNRVTRESQFATMNEVRTNAMREFDTRGQDR